MEDEEFVFIEPDGTEANLGAKQDTLDTHTGFTFEPSLGQASPGLLNPLDAPLMRSLAQDTLFSTPFTTQEESPTTPSVQILRSSPPRPVGLAEAVPPTGEVLAVLSSPKAETATPAAASPPPEVPKIESLVAASEPQRCHLYDEIFREQVSRRLVQRQVPVPPSLSQDERLPLPSDFEDEAPEPRPFSESEDALVEATQALLSNEPVAPRKKSAKRQSRQLRWSVWKGLGVLAGFGAATGVALHFSKSRQKTS